MLTTDNGQSRIVLAFVYLVVVLAGCRSAPTSEIDNPGQRKIRLVATTGMVGDVVKNVGGDQVDVIVLMGAGVDPHLYKASERDVIRLGQADLIFYSGLHLEAGMGKVFERIGKYSRRMISVTDGIDRTRLLSPPGYANAYDPHVWFDVLLWADTIDVVKSALIELDPANAGFYTANAQAYRIQLEELDHYIRKHVERVPIQQRILITAHDAFNYFGRAYGFEVIGLQGINTTSETSTLDVSELANFIVDQRVSVVFIESSVPKRNILALQAAVKARGWQVELGGELFSDALGSPGTEQSNYIGMVRYNVDTIIRSLSNSLEP